MMEMESLDVYVHCDVEEENMALGMETRSSSDCARRIKMWFDENHPCGHRDASRPSSASAVSENANFM